jgi:tRNA pseudouridine55 synthase
MQKKLAESPTSGLKNPNGISSLNRAPTRKIKIPKIGHAGTLDPLAEGVLLVLTGDDTKKQDFLMKQTKEYIAEIAFGAVSPTLDMEMVPHLNSAFPNKEIVGFENLEAFKQRIAELIPSFIGHITQTVPLYSAKKIEGKTLYKVARAGDGEAFTAEKGLPTKEVDVFEFENLGVSLVNVETDTGFADLPILKCRIRCSSGTYVRSIAGELGEKLGVGGVLISLIRSRVGEFSVEKSVRLEDVVL